MTQPQLSPVELLSLRDHAIQAALSSGKILRDHFRGDLKVSEKKDAGLVTQIDLESERSAVSLLEKVHSKFGFLTEEAAPKDQERPGQWIIDPLDGTTNYVHGFPMFCVSIGATWNQELVLGVIYQPLLDELFVATKGNGATINGASLRVSSTSELTQSLLVTGFTYQKEPWLSQEMKVFEKISKQARGVRRSGSAAMDLAYTARGVFDGFWEKRLSPWDVAAGILLVQEAGGMVSAFDGGPFRLEDCEILASNSKLHSELVQTIR